MEKNNKIEIINDLLGFEGLKIIQRPDIFNFSLDSTILASSVTMKCSDKKIIDLGCGNGYIPIFLTLRTKSHIYGVEIQEEIASLARRSVELNHLEEQITILNEDMKKLHTYFQPSSFDVVTCNPPYFPFQEDGNTNKSIYQKIARHEIHITLAEAIGVAFYLLKDKGTFALVHRASRMIEIIEELSKNRFEIKRMRLVYPKVDSPHALAIFIEASKNGKKGSLKIEKPLYVEKTDGTYTDEILEIFNYQKKV